MQSKALHQTGMYSSDMPDLSTARFASSAQYQQVQGVGNHTALRSGNHSFNNVNGTMHLSSEAAGWATQHSVQQVQAHQSAQLSRSIDPQAMAGQARCMLSSQHHGDSAMLLDTPQQQRASRAQMAADPQQAQWQAFSTAGMMSSEQMIAGAAALSSQQHCTGRAQFSAQDEQAQALMMRLREQLAKGSAQQAMAMHGLSTANVDGCRRVVQTRQWPQQGQNVLNTEISDEYLNDVQGPLDADLDEVDGDDEFNSSMTNESGVTDSEEDMPIMSNTSPCPPFSYNEGAPLYIAGTTKPKNGWFQPCRGCGSFTSRSLPVSERVVPLCTRCQSTWAQMAKGVYPPHTAEHLRNKEPLTLWLPSHVSLKPGVILEKQARSTMCLNILLQIDDQWQAYVDG